MLQCVAVCCSVSNSRDEIAHIKTQMMALQKILQYVVAVRCSVLQCVAVFCSVLKCVEGCCSVSLCCGVSQCVAV